MPEAGTQLTVLIPHPETPREPVSGIAVEVRRPAAGTLLLNYSLHGDVGRVRISGAQGTHSADGLWQHTCFEAFIAARGRPNYYEFNFSPTLAWAAYQFAEYRNGMAPAGLTSAPGLQVRRTADRLELAATVHLGGLAALANGGPLRVALAAVVEDHRGRLSYWALEHPPGKPDFHHPESFSLEVRAT
jgi:hypothetical protein